MDIDIALQNLMAILYCLDDESLINWTKKELEGYSIHDELPEYRKLKGRVMASFFVGYTQYPKRQFGIAHLDKDMQEKLLSINIYNSISALIEMRNSEGSIGRPIAPEFYAILQSNSNSHITSASVEIGLSSISDIISKIRGKILETLLFLEKEFGNLDELDVDISIKKPEEVKSIIKNIEIKLYDNSVSIGDNNKIKGSHILTNK